MEIKIRNVNHGVEEIFHKIKHFAVRETSRNGDVMVMPEPLTVTYTNPRERVLFWPERDANPFFHLMECIWMMAGRNDVEFVKYFNKRMSDFSDDGVVFNGAYGHRWRRQFGIDQVKEIVKHLKENPNSRRAVLTMWGTEEDLGNLSSKDVCCNTQAYFDLRGGKLNMTVTNRSNDVIWGMFGANAVHFSFLQEVMASALGVDPGNYNQFTNNAHLYLGVYDYTKYIESPPVSANFDMYRRGISPRKVVESNLDTFLSECEAFCNNPFGPYQKFENVFFYDVAAPMAQAYKERKEKRSNGMYWVEQIKADDWRIACRDWVSRRNGNA